MISLTGKALKIEYNTVNNFVSLQSVRQLGELPKQTSD